MFAAVALVVLALAAHAPAVWSGFIWDDDDYVIENDTLRSVAERGQIWLKSRATPQYFPLVPTTFWIEYRAWGLWPAGYHAVNVALHAAASVFLWILLTQ